MYLDKSIPKEGAGCLPSFGLACYFGFEVKQLISHVLGLD